MKMRNKEEVLEIEEPQHLQCQHEEADTLLAFHIEIPHFTESGHSRCYLLFLPAIWIPNIQYRGSKMQSLYARVCSDTGRELLARIKKINSSSLPPCTKTLSNHIKGAHYVARMWRRAVHINPTAEASPTDCRLPRKFCPGVTNLCIRQYGRCIHR